MFKVNGETVKAMMNAFPKAMIGWGGVFIVTIAIIAAIWALSKLGNKE